MTDSLPVVVRVTVPPPPLGMVEAQVASVVYVVDGGAARERFDDLREAVVCLVERGTCEASLWCVANLARGGRLMASWSASGWSRWEAK